MIEDTSYLLRPNMDDGFIAISGMFKSNQYKIIVEFRETSSIKKKVITLQTMTERFSSEEGYKNMFNMIRDIWKKNVMELDLDAFKNCIINITKSSRKADKKDKSGQIPI